MEQLRVPFRVWVPELDEVDDGDATSVALRNSRLKSGAARAHCAPDEIVVAVDTVVDLDGVVYGKPGTTGEARRMLEALRGRTHTVTSGLAMCVDGERHECVAHTAVTFRSFPQELLEAYLATGEWRERAGGYAIQGFGAALVAGVDGDYLNVVGFPVTAFLDLVERLGMLERLYAPSSTS